MKDNHDIEQMLLNGKDYEKIVKTKIENDFKQVLDDQKTIKGRYITDIKSAPKDKIFSKSATYEVINKRSKTRSFINGLQAEGYLGNKNSERQKLLDGEINYFVNEDNFVKFIKLKV